LCGDPAAGAAAAVELSASAGRHRVVRRLVDVLDGPSRVGDDARRTRLRAGGRIRVDERRRGLWRLLCGDRARTPVLDTPVSALVWTGVVVIGGLGSVLRFLVDGAVSSRLERRDFPFGTLVVNISGAAILGLLTGLALGDTAALLAGTAAVGSYTTF